MVMTETVSTSERLKTIFVLLTDVWLYSPNEDRKEWDGQYERVDGETRHTAVFCTPLVDN